MSNWHHVYLCQRCEKNVTTSVWISGGVCPYCGFDNHAEYLAVKKVIRRETTPWWKFWKREYEYK